jgi:hypothetical protein
MKFIEMHWPWKCMKGVHLSLEAFLIGEQMKLNRLKFGDDALTKLSGITKAAFSYQLHILLTS